MEITIVQAVLIGLWTGVCLSGMLLGIYTNRCLIMATGVGLILGDLPTGLAMGAVGELAFMGFGVSQGGSPYPTMRLEAIRKVTTISCRCYPKSFWNTSA